MGGCRWRRDRGVGCRADGEGGSIDHGSQTVESDIAAEVTRGRTEFQLLQSQLGLGIPADTLQTARSQTGGQKQEHMAPFAEEGKYVESFTESLSME
jgi:hypothetical protein